MENSEQISGTTAAMPINPGLSFTDLEKSLEDLLTVPVPEAPSFDQTEFLNVDKAVQEETTPVQSDNSILGSIAVPEFLRQMNEVYRANGAHVFIMHGNINDHPDNTGQPSNIERLLSTVYDTFWLAEAKETSSKLMGTPTASALPSFRPSVAAFYSMNDGLRFANSKGKKLWDKIMLEHYPQAAEDKTICNPGVEVDRVLHTLNLWFHASAARAHDNALQIAAFPGGLDAMKKNKQLHKLKDELKFTVVFFNADKIFPPGTQGQLNPGDRSPVAHIENWAKDLKIASRNRVIMVTRHITELNEAIRGGDSRVMSVRIKRPDLNDRVEWLNNFQKQIQVVPPVIAGKPVKTIHWAPGFGTKEMAIQCAGVPRTLMETAIMHSWVMNRPLDVQTVLEFKREAIESEYDGLVEFFEPTFGFEQIGGHDHLKQYFNQKVIKPLREGSSRCSKGVLLTGPPGTGKSVIAKALAFESKMNFLEGHLDRLFGGLVGETESKTRKFLEAVDSAAPLILFLDEIDSVLSSGRQSPGDSGTAGRVFNALMTWLSDESRRGKVVVVAASNRPDLLDAALTRPGRFDAILPCLPPAPKDAQGRMQILVALSKKYKTMFHEDMKLTVSKPQDGLGLLLHDEKIWTGAEIELVLNEAGDNAAEHDHKTIHVSDWNEAMRDIVANTREIDQMINLALWFSNNLKYCPEAYKERARDKNSLSLPDTMRGNG